MIVDIQTRRLRTIEQLRAFVEGAGDVEFKPQARLRTMPDAERFLKPGVTFDLPDAAATAETDLGAARRVQTERRELFRHIAADIAEQRSAC